MVSCFLVYRQGHWKWQDFKIPRRLYIPALYISILLNHIGVGSGLITDNKERMGREKREAGGEGEQEGVRETERARERGRWRKRGDREEEAVFACVGGLGCYRPPVICRGVKHLASLFR